MTKRELFTSVIVVLCLIKFIDGLVSFFPQLLLWEMNNDLESVPHTVYLLSGIIIPFLLIRFAKHVVNFLFQSMDLDKEIDLGALHYENTLQLAVIISGLVLFIRNVTGMFLSFSSILGANFSYYLVSIVVAVLTVIKARQISRWIIKTNSPGD